MKKVIAYFLFLLVLFLVQVASSKVFSESVQLVPQLVLLFVVIFALTHSLPEALWFGFIAGFFSELFSGLFFGTYILGLVAVGLAVYVITRHLTSQEVRVSTTVFLVILCSVLLPLLAYFFNLLVVNLYSGPGISFWNFFSFGIIWTVMSNLVFVYPLTRLFNVFSRFEGVKV